MPSDKDPASRRLIDGLKLIPTETLPKEFSRFEKDDLYFIQYCHYFDFAKGTTYSLAKAIAEAANPQNQSQGGSAVAGGSAAASTAGSNNAATNDKKESADEFFQRCLALTPAALFITDSNANLFRATKYENIKELLFQVTLKKKLFGAEKRLYINIRSDTEPDCYCYMDADQAKDFTDIFRKIMQERKKTGFSLIEIPESTPIREHVSTAIPQGYLTAQEIQRLNQNRLDVNDHINNVLQEINALNKELETLRPDVEAKRTVLKTMEGATTDDLTELRRKRQELHETHTKLQRTTQEMEIENNKVSQDIARVKEQLEEDKGNYEKLVKESVSTADNAASKEQDNMTLLRQKAQKREADRLSIRLAELTTELGGPSTYTGHDAFAAKAKALEAKIIEDTEKWVREMETANKMDKFLDNMSADIERVDEQLEIHYNQKMALIQEIERRLGVGAFAVASDNLDGFDDDDLVPSSSAKPPAPSAQALANRASIMVNAPVDLDEDLLGDSTNKAPTPTPPTVAAAVADDIDDI